MKKECIVLVFSNDFAIRQKLTKAFSIIKSYGVRERRV